MSKGINQEAAYADSMFILPGSCHFAKATQILVFLVVEFLDGAYLVTRLGDFPASTIICVGIFETAVILFENGLNFNVKVFVQYPNDKAINEYFCTRVSCLNCVLCAGKQSGLTARAIIVGPNGGWDNIEHIEV